MTTKSPFKQIQDYYFNNDYEWPSHKNKKVLGWSYREFIQNNAISMIMNGIFTAPENYETIYPLVCEELKSDWSLWKLQFKLTNTDWKEQCAINNHH